MDIRKKIIKIASNILADINFNSQKEFEEYLKNHPNYREDTKFFVDGMQVSAPPREKNKSDVGTTEERKKLHDMAMVGDEKDRCSVARDKKTHPYTLSILSKDDSEYVRQEVAANPKTHQSTLKNLSKDKNRDVRISVATNPNITMKTIQNLSDDDDIGVKIGVMYNKKTPIQILEKLKNDENHEVRNVAKKQINKRNGVSYPKNSDIYL